MRGRIHVLLMLGIHGPPEFKAFYRYQSAFVDRAVAEMNRTKFQSKGVDERGNPIRLELICYMELD
eukprot:7064236-Karenia_brevis.AAC.1